MSTTKPDPPLSWAEGRRRRAWDLHLAGWTQTHIAAALGVSQAAVSQWLQRAAVGGVDALRAHPPPGPTPLLPAAQLAALVRLLDHGAEAAGFQGAVWTRRRVAQVIAEQFGVRYHPTHVGRLLRQLGWTPQRPIVRATQRDEVAIAAWYAERWPTLKKSASAKAELSSG